MLSPSAIRIAVLALTWGVSSDTDGPTPCRKRHAISMADKDAVIPHVRLRGYRAREAFTLSSRIWSREIDISGSLAAQRQSLGGGANSSTFAASLISCKGQSHK